LVSWGFSWIGGFSEISVELKAAISTFVEKLGVLFIISDICMVNVIVYFFMDPGIGGIVLDIRFV
jgi:hypothetical protein